MKEKTNFFIMLTQISKILLNLSSKTYFEVFFKIMPFIARNTQLLISFISLIKMEQIKASLVGMDLFSKSKYFKLKITK
jgi:hypothetical protein